LLIVLLKAHLDNENNCLRENLHFIGGHLNDWKTTKLRPHNTRICSLAGWRAISSLCSRIHLVVPRQRMLPQTAKCP